MKLPQGEQKRLFLELLVLNPGREYTTDEIAWYVASRIPPEQAIREFLREQRSWIHKREARRAKGIPPSVSRLPREYTLEEQVRFGLRRMVNDRFHKYCYNQYLTRRRIGRTVYFSWKATVPVCDAAHVRSPEVIRCHVASCRRTRA